jgi:hypothetical protein
MSLSQNPKLLDNLLEYLEPEQRGFFSDKITLSQLLRFAKGADYAICQNMPFNYLWYADILKDVQEPAGDIYLFTTPNDGDFYRFGKIIRECKNEALSCLPGRHTVYPPDEEGS